MTKVTRADTRPQKIPGTNIAISNHNLLKLMEDLRKEEGMIPDAELGEMMTAVKKEIQRRKERGLM